MKKQHVIYPALFLILTSTIFLKGCEKDDKKEEIIKEIPEVTTLAISQITSVSAHSGGNVTSDGNAPVVTRGIVWHTESDPSLETHLGKTTDGEGTGEFTSELSDLEPGTTYYVRAWATNSEGTAYGAEIDFTTAIELAGITTKEILNITATSAETGGEVTSDGGAEIIEKGVVWHTQEGPDTENYTGKSQHGEGMGSFTSQMEELTPGTDYFVRAYAINNEGIAYGNEITFTTLAVLATVETGDATVISADSAMVTGTVLYDGGAEVSLKGIIWAEHDEPNLDSHDGIWEEAGGVGDIEAYLTDLSPETEYFARAFATNSVGTAYGDVVSFTTPSIVSVPTVITHEVTSIMHNRATAGGNVTESGGAPVTERGVVYSVHPNPTTLDSLIKSRRGLGEYIALITNLEPETTYYVKAYAINSAGTAYGEEVEFTTASTFGQPCPGAPTVTDIEGNVYNTVLIGDQCWLKEDLRTITYNDGNPIAAALDGEEWAENTSGAYTWLDGQESEGELYGVIYNWYAVDTEKLCPVGWWVPTDSDWQEMLNYVIDNIQNATEENVTSFLKSCRQEDSPLGGECNTNEHPRWDTDPEHYGNNQTGFSALPGGSRNYTGNYYYGRGMISYWWTSTQLDATTAWHYRFRFDESHYHRIHYAKGNGYMVRCIRK